MSSCSTHSRRLLLLVSAVLATAVCRAQDPFAQADALMKEYRFEEALDAYSSLLPEDGAPTDSLLAEKAGKGMDQARNALSMKRFCCTPKVLAKKKIPKEDFHLFYPLPDASWVSSPGTFPDEGGFGTVTWFPEGSTQAYFIGRNGRGDKAIFHTEKSGRLWTAPTEVDMGLPQVSEMLFPVLSPDGLSLFFSCAQLYGVGGYDLYVSRRKSLSEGWGLPENLGFPFSSPYDDFLYMETPDGQYTVFASDRECPGSGDLVIYVLEYDSMPLRHGIDDPVALARLCQLKGSAGTSTREENPAQEPGAYASLQREYADLKASMSADRSALEDLRHSLSGDPDNGDLKRRITQGESSLVEKGRRLEDISARLAKEELALIDSGSVPVRGIRGPAGGKEGENDGPALSVQLRRHREGAEPELAFMVRKEAVDYRFTLLPTREGRMVPDSTLPEGLVFQIQLFSRSEGEVKASELKGLSPVFVKNEGGKTICSVGIFSEYDDAEKALATVKKAGFRSAFVSAYSEGEKMSLSSARQLHNSTRGDYVVEIRPPEGRLEDRELAAVKKASAKDMTREISGEGVVYVLGPYSDVAEAMTVLSALEAESLEGLKLKRLK